MSRKVSCTVTVGQTSERHNHSSGYDNYIGGGSVYLKKGDTMLVPDYDNYLVPTEVTLNFTYMTAATSATTVPPSTVPTVL